MDDSLGNIDVRVLGDDPPFVSLSRPIEGHTKDNNKTRGCQIQRQYHKNGDIQKPIRWNGQLLVQELPTSGIGLASKV